MNLDDYLEELRELVSVDSGTLTPDGVTRVARLMEKKYASIGWHTELKDLGDTVGKGLFATNKPGAAKFDALLVGHMDTVFREGTAAERPMTMDGGFAYGPGVADMKSGLLNMFWTVKGLEKVDSDRLAIAVALNPEEETGSNTAKKWLMELAKESRVAFIFEAARGEGGQMVKARRGMGRFLLTFAGAAAHAGNEPEKGRSAIHEMAHCIVALTELADKEKGTSINVGLVSGGEAANVVAPLASATLDVRFWRNEEFERVQKAIEALCRKSRTPDITISARFESAFPAMTQTPAAAKYMKLVEECGATMGVKIIWQESGGASDGNHIAVLGVPVLDGFGPVGGFFHSTKEFLELASIIPRITLARETLRSL